MNEGWFKIHRCLFKKAIWLNSTPEQKVILITLLGMANHEGKEWEWQGKQFKANPGEFVTSSKSIIEKAGKGISRQNVRTALEKFKKYEFLTYESTKTGMLINIVNWGDYQGKSNEANQRINQQVTNGSPTPNQQVTTNKNDKNIKNDKNEKKEEEAQLQPLSFPTPFHEIIFNQWHEISYRTWFEGCEIEEKEHLIIITVKEALKKTAIQNSYADPLRILLGKDISIKCIESEE